MGKQASLDTKGQFVHSTDDEAKPRLARFLVGPQQVVIAASAEETYEIPYGDIFDVTVSLPPSHLDVFAGDILTIAYRQNRSSYTITFDAETESPETCALTLLQNILTGLEVIVRHPVRLGDTLQNPGTSEAQLFLTSEGIGIEISDTTIAIRLDDIIGYQKQDRTISGTDRPLVEIRHLDDDQVVATHVVLESGATQQLLGRYLQRANASIRQRISDIDLSKKHCRTLLALYRGAPIQSLQTVLADETDGIQDILETLIEEDLITDEKDPAPTKAGYVTAEMARQGLEG